MVLATSAFFGLKLDLRAQETLCDDICDRLKNRPQDGCFRHQCLNAVKLPQAQKHAELYHALQNADCLSPDGMGIVWAARLIGIPVGQRVTGIDLMTALLPRFAKSGTRVFLLGAKPDVVETLWNTLPIRYPGLVIAGAHHGYEPNDDKLAAIIRERGAHALFVALPSPRKELFVDSIAAKTGCRFAMGVGGAFDVLAGEVHRAPVIWQKCGLEFLWRILCQPRRMMPRYVRGLVRFTKLTVPVIFRYQAKRLAKRTAVVLMLGGVICSVMNSSDGNSVWAATFDPPDLSDPQATENWIKDRMVQVTTRDDLSQTIDDIVSWVLPAEVSRENALDGAENPIDWDGVDVSIKALLTVFQTVLKVSGANSFLIEAVIGGVIGRLLDLHPDPDRVARLITITAPNLANAIFGNRQVALFDADRTLPVWGANLSNVSVISHQTAPPEKDRFVQPFLYWIEPNTEGFKSEASSWGGSESEESAFDFVSEDASPR